jgi:hypothetical protein
MFIKKSIFERHFKKDDIDENDEFVNKLFLFILKFNNFIENNESIADPYH